MLFPKMKFKPEWQMGASAVIVILAAEAAMTDLTVPMRPIATNEMTTIDIVSQNATALEAAPSMPGIVAEGAESGTESGAAPTDDCQITMDLLEDDNAMIGMTLLAPCLPDTDLLISHAGLVFSAKTMASGSLFLSLPALTEQAKVAVKFSNGETAESSIVIPDIGSMRRFVVQWPESDGFSVHAYEGKAGFDDPGHIWAENLATPSPAGVQDTGYLTLLGDPMTELPMLAQVYTYSSQTQSEIIVEAAVTENNCGFDLMGDALSSVGGKVEKTEITVAMPDCTAIGDYMQLPDLAPDLKLALAN
jgi:hypothetical protein